MQQEESGSAPFPLDPPESVLGVPPRSQTCDYCASSELEWVKCKLICRNCRHIVMSCADL